jgi:hypothetical protein
MVTGMREIAIAGGGRESSRCLLVPREICTPGLPTLGRLPDHRCHLTHRHRVHGLALPDGGHMSRAPTSVRGQPARADSSHVRWGGRPTISRGFCSRLWSPSALHSARTSSSSAILTPCATPSGNRAASPVWGYALIEPQLCRNRLQPRVCKEAASDCLQGRALRSQEGSAGVRSRGTFHTLPRLPENRACGPDSVFADRGGQQR